MLRYVDTSAVAKVLLPEARADALRAYLNDGTALVSSDLLRVELLRAVARRQPAAAPATAEFLAAVQLLPIDGPVIDGAIRLRPAELRSLDAIHLATALSLGDDISEFITYDRQLGAAAAAAGLRVAAPGFEHLEPRD